MTTKALLNLDREAGVNNALRRIWTSWTEGIRYDGLLSARYQRIFFHLAWISLIFTGGIWFILRTTIPGALAKSEVDVKIAWMVGVILGSVSFVTFAVSIICCPCMAAAARLFARSYEKVIGVLTGPFADFHEVSDWDKAKLRAEAEKKMVERALAKINAEKRLAKEVNEEKPNQPTIDDLAGDIACRKAELVDTYETLRTFDLVDADGYKRYFKLAQAKLEVPLAVVDRGELLPPEDHPEPQ